jgi:hypothetical protein
MSMLGAMELFLYGIIPDTGYLAINASEERFDDYRTCFPVSQWKFDYENRLVRIPVVQGNLSFIFGSEKVTHDFSSSGVYDIQFTKDWNSIVSTSKIEDIDQNETLVTTPSPTPSPSPSPSQSPSPTPQSGNDSNSNTPPQNNQTTPTATPSQENNSTIPASPSPTPSIQPSQTPTSTPTDGSPYGSNKTAFFAVFILIAASGSASVLYLIYFRTKRKLLSNTPA